MNARRHSEMLPRLGGIRSTRKSILATQLDSIEEKQTRLGQTEHKPRITKQMTLRGRQPHNRPNLNVEAVDHEEIMMNSPAPNIVIAPMGGPNNGKNDDLH